MKTEIASQSTPVIFRRFRDGEVLAVFPTIPWNSWDATRCTCYAHKGQHGGASVFIADRTKPATPDEYAPLKRELESIGYTLAPCLRFTPKHEAARRAVMHNW